MKACLVLLAALLTGCSMNHGIMPASNDRQPIVTMSAYTKTGCWEKIRWEAINRKWEIKEIDESTDVGGVVAEVLLFPFVKGISCSAYIAKGEIPQEF